MPAPITLPSVVISGLTPKYSCAPPIASLKPVMTSSNIRSISFSAVTALTSSRYPFSGVIVPILPSTGSMISAAISPLFASIRLTSDSMSLYGTCSVFFVKSRGTPSESGTPWVVAPDPALTRHASCAP